MVHGLPGACLAAHEQQAEMNSRPDFSSSRIYPLPRIPRVLNTLHHWPSSPGLFSMLAVVTLSSCGWYSRRRRRRGDKIKRDVVVRRLTFFRCRAAFNQVERAYRDGYAQS